MKKGGCELWVFSFCAFVDMTFCTVWFFCLGNTRSGTRCGRGSRGEKLEIGSYPRFLGCFLTERKSATHQKPKLSSYCRVPLVTLHLEFKSQRAWKWSPAFFRHAPLRTGRK